MEARVFLLNWLALVSLMVVGGNGSLFAQENRATILGRIADSTNAVIVGARIVVENVDTGIEIASSSNEAGNYRVPSLPPGRYRVSVETAGFKRAESEVTLMIQQQARLDFTLEVGNVTETVYVSAEAPLLVTDDTTLGQVVDSQKIRLFRVFSG